MPLLYAPIEQGGFGGIDPNRRQRTVQFGPQGGRSGNTFRNQISQNPNFGSVWNPPTAQTVEDAAAGAPKTGAPPATGNLTGGGGGGGGGGGSRTFSAPRGGISANVTSGRQRLLDLLSNRGGPTDLREVRAPFDPGVSANVDPSLFPTGKISRDDPRVSGPFPINIPPTTSPVTGPIRSPSDFKFSIGAGKPGKFTRTRRAKSSGGGSVLDRLGIGKAPLPPTPGGAPQGVDATTLASLSDQVRKMLGV